MRSFRATSTQILGITENLEKQELALRNHKEELAKVERSLQDLDIADIEEDDDIIPITAKERDLTLTLIPELQKVCDEALLVTGGTSQKFGKITAVNNSFAAAGI